MKVGLKDWKGGGGGHWECIPSHCGSETRSEGTASVTVTMYGEREQRREQSGGLGSIWRRQKGSELTVPQVPLPASLWG